MTKLDNKPGAKPLYTQVYEILVEKLENREYEEADILPTENEFQELFGISRITARKALEKLVNDGYVKRERGIGTIVLKNYRNREVDIWTTNRDLKPERIERKVIKMGEKEAPKFSLETFEVEAGTKVKYVERILLQKGRPLSIHTIFLPPNIDVNLTKEELEESFYLSLERRNFNIDRYEESLMAGVANEYESKLLGVEIGHPLLIKERTSYLANGEVIECTIGKHLSEYYSYRVSVK